MSQIIVRGSFHDLCFVNQKQFETAIQEEVEKRLAEALKKEKQKLLDQIIEIEEEESLIPDQGFYHEYEKNRQKMEREKQELYFDQKKMELVQMKMDMENKSVDLQKQLLELIKMTNLQEMNKKELEIAQQILDFKAADLEHTHQIQELENKIWQLQQHTKQEELKRLADSLKNQKSLLAIYKEKNIQDVNRDYSTRKNNLMCACTRTHV